MKTNNIVGIQNRGPGGRLARPFVESKPFGLDPLNKKPKKQLLDPINHSAMNKDLSAKSPIRADHGAMGSTCPEFGELSNVGGQIE